MTDKRETPQIAAGQIWVSASQVGVRFGLSRTTVWRRVKHDPTFPKPTKFGHQTRRWNLADLEAWLLAQR